MPDEWYDLVEGDDVQQGDLLLKCPVYKPVIKFPVAADEIVDLEFSIHDLIVLTQSCDLVKGQKKFVREVVFCSAPTLTQARATANHTLANKQSRENLVKYSLLAFHPLKASDHPEVQREMAVVEFGHVVTLPIDYVRSFCEKAGKRLRLRSPYREFLAQRFAYSFARIGVPGKLELPE